MKHPSNFKGMEAKKRKAAPKSPAEILASQAPVLHTSAEKLPASGPTSVLNVSAVDRIGSPDATGVSDASLNDPLQPKLPVVRLLVQDF